jgi:RNA recognition motif-containing protein
MNIYVGNLSYSTTESGLTELFGAYGKVDRASIIMDRETGRSRGYGFVEMSDDGAAQQAIEALDGKEWEGRTLKVNPARPKESGSGGGGRDRGGERRGGGGYGRR